MCIGELYLVLTTDSFLKLAMGINPFVHHEVILVLAAVVCLLLITLLVSLDILSFTYYLQTTP